MTCAQTERGLTVAEYERRRGARLEQVAAVNLFHDFRPQGGKPPTGCFDAQGNYFPSLAAAAAAYGVTASSILKRIKSGKWRRA
jgi:hypothetical protein